MHRYFYKPFLSTCLVSDNHPVLIFHTHGLFLYALHDSNFRPNLHHCMHIYSLVVRGRLTTAAHEVPSYPTCSSGRQTLGIVLAHVFLHNHCKGVLVFYLISFLFFLSLYTCAWGICSSHASPESSFVGTLIMYDSEPVFALTVLSPLCTFPWSCVGIMTAYLRNDL